jgi:hypothetical protein
MSRPAPPGPVAGRGRLPVPARDRRPALAALALLLVVVGALGAALVVYRSGKREDVLVTAHEVRPGQRIDASDLTTVRISADTANVLDANLESRLVGNFATTDIPSGTIINRNMFTTGADVLPSNGVVVGVTAVQTLRTAEPIEVGDVVRLYAAPKSTTSSAATQAVPSADITIVSAARVVDAGPTSNGNPQSISVLVDDAHAQSLVPWETEQFVDVAILPTGTKPLIDFQNG